MSPRGWRWWPRTLFARLTLILFVGLALAHALSFQLVAYERSQAGMSMMLGNLEQNLASAVALLDRLPAAERSNWLPFLARDNYRLQLDAGTSGPPADTLRTRRVVAAIAGALGPRRHVSANLLPGASDRLQVHLRLRDGSPVTIDLTLQGLPMASWLPLLLLAQLALICICTWLAVRLATRPLAELANAADTLGPEFAGTRLPENGPTEVAHAATAFNAMQDRIAASMSERMQILAAISHDLQTPITRMRLRVEMMEADPQSAALLRNLQEMEALAREGIAYARTLHATAEVPIRIDPDALLDSLAFDYQDAGQALTLDGHIGHMLVTRPLALRRILANLIDNALKFAGAAELSVLAGATGQVTIMVLDRGSGIPDDQLEAVFQPFFRLESSRNRDSGGTGLGLAIARQLASAMNATLTLHNRAGGGIEARLTLPADSSESGKTDKR
jgi:signal transduction histidine kinase